MRNHSLRMELSEGPCESLIYSPNMMEVILKVESEEPLEEFPPNHSAVVGVTLPNNGDWSQEGNKIMVHGKVTDNVISLTSYLAIKLINQLSTSAIIRQIIPQSISIIVETTRERIYMWSNTTGGLFRNAAETEYLPFNEYFSRGREIFK